MVDDDVISIRTNVESALVDGTQYTSQNFDQLTKFGCTITTFDPYIANDKGMDEKFFDLIQETYKPLLKGKGVIEDDFGERGAPDYRKTASLTLAAFEKGL